MTPTKAPAVAAVLLALFVAGCGSSSKSSSSSSAAASPPTTAAPVTAAPAAAAQGAAHSRFASIGTATATGLTVSLARSSQGIFLIGPNGHSLYVFAKDTGSTATCTGECAKTWPAFTSSGTITTGPVVNKAEVGTSNGQVTFYGHPLYYFSHDSAPGQTNGVGITNWNLIGPFGNVMLPRG
jgi:predicted lipoprotein with Yx(FWY)xxD motif